MAFSQHQARFFSESSYHFSFRCTFPLFHRNLACSRLLRWHGTTVAAAMKRRDRSHAAATICSNQPLTLVQAFLRLRALDTITPHFCLPSFRQLGLPQKCRLRGPRRHTRRFVPEDSNGPTSCTHPFHSPRCPGRARGRGAMRTKS